MDINEQYAIAIQGDRIEREKLFEALSVRFRLFLYQRIRVEADAQDIAQEALATIAAAFDQVTIETSFAAWAYKVLENKIFTFVKKDRKRKVEISADGDDGSFPATWGADPSVKQQLLECLRKICEVNGRYARVLNLHYLGFTTDEICDRMRLSRTNSYVILSRARLVLKGCLEKGTVE